MSIAVAILAAVAYWAIPGQPTAMGAAICTTMQYVDRPTPPCP